MEKIGDRIKRRRELLKMSQDDLAKKLGYKSRSSINKIERDAGGLPQAKIAAIAKALDTTPGYIMGWEEEIENDPVGMAGIHAEMIMDEDLMEIFEDFKKLSPEAKKYVKKIIHSMVDEEV